MSVRSAAVRRAAQIRGERAAAFAAREAEIEQRAVEFLEASAQAENVVEAARRRCEHIMTTAQVAAERARGRAAAAVADLEGLGVPRGEIVQITGLTGRQVRELLASRPPASTVAGPGEPDSTVVAGGDDGAAEHGAARTREGTEDADLSSLGPTGEVLTPRRTSGPSPEPDRYGPRD